MIKSRSCSSGITRDTSSQRLQSPMLKFNNKKIENCTSSKNVDNPFTKLFPLKFPKRLIHKPTAMNMLIQTQQSNKKLCLKANPAAHKATMLEEKTTRRQLKSGDFSHLAYESPSKPIRQRQFEDIGTMSNRKKPNKDQFNSTCMLASINQHAEGIGPEKTVRNIEKKHFKVAADLKKQLEWAQEKPNKDRFLMKYQRVGQQNTKQKTKQSNYTSIHLKYTVHK